MIVGTPAGRGRDIREAGIHFTKNREKLFKADMTVYADIWELTTRKEFCNRFHSFAINTDTKPQLWTFEGNIEAFASA